MSEPPDISHRLLIRDLVRRHPRTITVLQGHGVQAIYAHLSIELAAKASGCRWNRYSSSCGRPSQTEHAIAERHVVVLCLDG